MNSTYTDPRWKDKIHSLSPKIGLEIGSLHGLDAIETLKEYNLEKMYIFECNPTCIDIVQKNISDDDRFELFKYAAWNTDEEISFFPVVESYDIQGNPSHKNEMHSCNIGASSCFKSNGTWPYEKYIQAEIKVPGKRTEDVLSERGVDRIDFICMDAQGAELHALIGLEKYLPEVKAIITELEIEAMYENQSLFHEVVKFLEERGFYLEQSHIWSSAGDFLFINKKFVI